jgi:hypothetical protein
MAHPGSSTTDAARGPPASLQPIHAPALQTKLRIGLAEQSVLVALGHAVQLHQGGSSDKDGKLADRLERAAQLVKQAYSECPSYDVVSHLMREHMVPLHCCGVVWCGVVQCHWRVKLCLVAWWHAGPGQDGQQQPVLIAAGSVTVSGGRVAPLLAAQQHHTAWLPDGVMRTLLTCPLPAALPRSWSPRCWSTPSRICPATATSCPASLCAPCWPSPPQAWARSWTGSRWLRWLRWAGLAAGGHGAAECGACHCCCCWYPP